MKNPKIIVALDYTSAEAAWALVERLDPRDRKSTRLNSSHLEQSRMPSSA